MSRNNGRRRIITGIITFLMIIFVLFGYFLVALESEHDCIGEECLICECIEQCESILINFGRSVALKLILAVPLIICLLKTLISITRYADTTPVSQKVQLNN
ncbi:MAG: hypothetical protein IJ757_09030 [Clostridiales bacterium]|nr:hypothetical protein [Clostridiales bacterium]